MQCVVQAILFDIDGTLVDSTAAVERTWRSWAAVAQLEPLDLSDLDDVIALPATQTLLPLLPPDRWAAVTSGSRALMQARLTAAGLPIPTVLVSAEDVSAGKPDPAGYRKAADALGYGIARCLVVEHAPAGIEAGRVAGAAVLAVATSHSRRELASATTVIPDTHVFQVFGPLSGTSAPSGLCGAPAFMVSLRSGQLS